MVQEVERHPAQLVAQEPGTVGGPPDTQELETGVGHLAVVRQETKYLEAQTEEVEEQHTQTTQEEK